MSIDALLAVGATALPASPRPLPTVCWTPEPAAQLRVDPIRVERRRRLRALTHLRLPP